MAKVDITVPGERIVESFTALVSQPTAPTTARSPDVGLVELSYVNPTELIPGPPGPPGPRGSRWYTGVGAPAITGAVLGDMYLDDTTGDIWVWDGTAWVNTGTNLTPTPAAMLGQIKTVDGAGSGLDADLLDGQDGTWYLDRVNHTGVQAISTVTGLQPALDLKAPLASPTFTGDPKAPTPAPGDADQSIATTAFVGAAITTATVPPATVVPLMDGTGAVGTVLKYAKEDHRHPTDTTRVGEAPNDGLTYGRKSLTWATIVGGAVVSDTAPGAPLQNGQLWFKSNSGDTFIYVDDGNSTQWVQQNILPTTGQFPVATAETRNRIVNGAMQISQENGDTAGTAAQYYPADQWFSYIAGLTILGNGRAAASPDGMRSIYTQVSTAKPSLAAGDLWQVVQNIEGVRLRDFQYGTALAKQSIFRFSIMTTNSPGTYTVKVSNNSNRVFLAQFTTAAVNVWVTISIVVPGDVTGTWAVDTALGMQIGFVFAAGTTNLGSAGWQAGGASGITGQTNAAAVTNAVFHIANVGLYLDPLSTGRAPAWTMPDEAAELAACQRYWQKCEAAFFSGNVTTAIGYYVAGKYTVPLRTTPTLTGVSTDAASFPATVGGLGHLGDIYYEARTANATASSGRYRSLVTVNARM